MFLFVALTACEDLNYTEVTTNDEEWVYNSPIYGVQRLVDDVYAHIRYDFGKYNGAMNASATDESDYALSLSDIHKFYDGGWSSIVSFSDTWSNSYQAIAQANEFLEKLDKVSLDDYIHNPIGSTAYDLLKSRFELFPYEARFLRAYFYFELAKTYGDVPLVTKTLSNDEANAVTRTPAQEIFRYIVDECDAIAEFLPITYKTEQDEQTGRASRPMAIALKARTLLYAASPLFNSSNNIELWKQAALANKAIIDKAPGWDIKLSSYAALWGNDNHLNPEIIFVRRTGSNNSFERYNYPVGVENGNSGNCPTQNLVDAYEYKTTGITFGETWGATINSTNNPYEDLDPRFALTVVRNGDSWPNYNNTPIETFEGGRNASPLLNATATGYYLKKYCDGSVNISTNNSNTKYHSWIVYRLAEFYLNYAEAVYNYLGDADAKGEFGMSANEAINVLRDRADIQMPHFSGSSDFAGRYIHERMVELAFEDHRFWDVRRWKKGADYFTTINIMKIAKSGDATTYTRQTKSRLWNDRNYLFPIPFEETKINPNLTQNPGW
jgi:hypothetical protein